LVGDHGGKGSQLDNQSLLVEILSFLEEIFSCLVETHALELDKHIPILSLLAGILLHRADLSYFRGTLSRLSLGLRISMVTVDLDLVFLSCSSYCLFFWWYLVIESFYADSFFFRKSV
jgi:hypothetical protein